MENGADVAFWDTRLWYGNVGRFCSDTQSSIEADHHSMIWPIVRTPWNENFEVEPHGLVCGAMLVPDLSVCLESASESWAGNSECGRLINDPFLEHIAMGLFPIYGPLQYVVREFGSLFLSVRQVEAKGTRVFRPIISQFTPAIYGNEGWKALRRRMRQKGNGQDED